EQIKKELRWLGIDWEDNNTFAQADARALEAHENVLKVLEMAGLTELTSDKTVALKSLPSSSYYCVSFDWRNGAKVVHRPPRANKGRNVKTINLVRSDDEGGNPFYRYAGLVDDVRLSEKDHLMYVVRDNRQRYFTQVQAHIRQALELARQELKSNPVAIRLFLKSGIDPQKSIPLPLYVHVPVVTDNGEVKRQTNSESTNRPQYEILRKRKEGVEEEKVLDEFVLAYFEKQQVLPESIAAYLVGTIVRPNTDNGNWRKHLASIATMFAHLGVNQGLRFLGQTFNVEDLVRSQKSIHCNRHEIMVAERFVLRSMPGWRLKHNIRQAFKEADDNNSTISVDLI